jgi:hypothetical protein
MIVVTEQCFIGEIEVSRTIQFDSIEELNAYCEEERKHEEAVHKLQIRREKADK